MIESVCGALKQMSKQKESKALELAVEAAGSPLLCPLKGAEQTLWGWHYVSEMES